MVYVYPHLVEMMNPIGRSHIFQMGWFNHQLAPRPLPETMDNMTNEVAQQVTT